MNGVLRRRGDGPVVAELAEERRLAIDNLSVCGCVRIDEEHVGVRSSAFSRCRASGSKISAQESPNQFLVVGIKKG